MNPRLFLLHILLVTINWVACSQSIPIGDFEKWEENIGGSPVPAGWILTDRGHGSGISRSGGYQSKYAVCLSVQWDDFMRENLGTTLSTEIWNIPGKCRMLSGYMKGTSAGGDSLSIEILMYSGNQPVGTGRYETGGSTGEWIIFSVDILYRSTVIPDKAEIIIRLKPGRGGHPGTCFCLDSLTLSSAMQWKPDQS